MAFNGSGVFSRLYNWATEQLSSPIEISKLDLQEEDIATALSNCILRDGTGVPTAATPWNSQKITGLGDATAATDAMNQQASDARYAVFLKKCKTTDTARISTTTLTDDPTLASIPLVSGVPYMIDLLLILTGASVSGMGFKANLYFTGTLATGGHGYFASSGGSLASGPFSVQTVSGTESISSTTVLTLGNSMVFGKFGIVPTSSGNLSVQWAQNSSTANNLSLKTGSLLAVTKLA